MSRSGASRERAQYPHGHQPSVLASHARRTARSSCAYFLDRVHPGQRILDIGCGPGSITLDLAELVGASGAVVGVDTAEEAIAAACRSAVERGDRRTRFMVGDLHALDLAPGYFDIVHAHQVLQHLMDPVAALRAMARFAAPDGIVCVRDADHGAMAWYPEVSGLERWRAVYTRSARALGGEPDAGRRLRAWVRAAGLEMVHAGSSTWTYAEPESARWWGSSQAERVVGSSFAARATEAGLSRKEIGDIAADWREWGEHPDAWFTLPHGEIIAEIRRG